MSYSILPHKIGIRLLGIAENPANSFPARLLVIVLLGIIMLGLGGPSAAVAVPGGWSELTRPPLNWFSPGLVLGTAGSSGKFGSKPGDALV